MLVAHIVVIPNFTTPVHSGRVLIYRAVLNVTLPITIYGTLPNTVHKLDIMEKNTIKYIIKQTI